MCTLSLPLWKRRTCVESGCNAFLGCSGAVPSLWVIKRSVRVLVWGILVGSSPSPLRRCSIPVSVTFTLGFTCFLALFAYTCCLVCAIRCFIYDVFLVPSIMYVTRPCMIISFALMVLPKLYLLSGPTIPVLLQSVGLLRTSLRSCGLVMKVIRETSFCYTILGIKRERLNCFNTLTMWNLWKIFDFLLCVLVKYPVVYDGRQCKVAHYTLSMIWTAIPCNNSQLQVTRVFL
jgi:hypothetical protein